ncbi:hypothetical protein [Hymenobacter volaticus]|uniref:Uncharacterized protein n=1 Tax=Hymenobacter volaticus TaxID=2932254 RepID=A0ABY4GIE0_9BACT|nr:hypothetical protein [Hymenobacter volaticus]UOQ69924.1 hypothetical protein MUN86_30500 [Hymenobacter volaticus]
MVVYHEALPTGYLLVLAPDAGATTETELADHLTQASRSGRPTVWVDCRLLDTLSPRRCGCCGRVSYGCVGEVFLWSCAELQHACSKCCSRRWPASALGSPKPNRLTRPWPSRLP